MISKTCVKTRTLFGTLCERHSTTRGSIKLPYFYGLNKVITRIATAQNLHFSWCWGPRVVTNFFRVAFTKIIGTKKCQTLSSPKHGEKMVDESHGKNPLKSKPLKARANFSGGGILTLIRIGCDGGPRW